jgi:hypothetical protein
MNESFSRVFLEVFLTVPITSTAFSKNSSSEIPEVGIFGKSSLLSSG